nr:type II toxin-antitoxin system YafQ family toxin [uncultured Treponema sp.]
MYEIVYTNRMKRDAKLMKKRGRNLEKLVEVLNLLASGNPLPQKYKDHQLTGNLNDFRECHIEPGWLLMYQIFENELILSTTATGSHSVYCNEVLDIIDSYIDIKEAVC